MYDNNNIFAKIIDGKIPCKKIYEDKDVLFFEDIKPVSKVHILGIPKVQCVDFSDFVLNYDKGTVANFFQKTDIVIEMLGIKDSGYRIISNSGADGGRNSKMGEYLGQGMTFQEAKKTKMANITVEGADLALEIGQKTKSDFDSKTLPLMISMIDTICEEKPLKVNWKNFK